jgi:predicted nucleic acid-binding protein
VIRVLVDTNVILDALLERQPWVAEAATIWQANLTGEVAAHMTATSLTDVFYIGRRLPAEPVPGRPFVLASTNCT